MKTFARLLLVCSAGAAPVSPALAADILDLPPVYQEYESYPEVVPVEIGSGWYLRGDVSYDFESEFDGGYRLFGGSYRSYDFDDAKIDGGFDFGAGVGYQFTDYFRGDLTANYWKHDYDARDTLVGIPCTTTSAGRDCRFENGGSIKSLELMANAYVDLGTFIGLTPYVGGGLGAVKVEYADVATGAQCVNAGADCGLVATYAHEGQKDWRFAYALMAGAAYDISKNLKLDVGYRYLNVEEGDMFGFDAASIRIGASGAQGADQGFDRHTIRAGIRYSIF